MGVSVDMPVSTPAAPPAFEVMAPNAASFRVWLAVETQWRVAVGMAGLRWLGLDYGSLDVVMRRLDPPDPDTVFADVMMMEAEALSVFWQDNQ